MRPPYSGLQAHAAAVDNPIVLGRRYCVGCGRWRPVHDYPRIARQQAGGLRSRCWACHRAYQRRWLAERSADERELYREYARIWQEAKRREAGIQRRVYRRRSVVDRTERVLLDPGPILSELHRRRAELAEIALQAGVTPRTLFRYTHGESARIRLDVADRLAMALGIPLATLYPEDR